MQLWWKFGSILKMVCRPAGRPWIFGCILHSRPFNQIFNISLLSTKSVGPSISNLDSKKIFTWSVHSWEKLIKNYDWNAISSNPTHSKHPPLEIYTYNVFRFIAHLTTTSIDSCLFFCSAQTCLYTIRRAWLVNRDSQNCEKLNRKHLQTLNLERCLFQRWLDWRTTEGKCHAISIPFNDNFNEQPNIVMSTTESLE